MNNPDYFQMIEIPVASCDVTYKKRPSGLFGKRRNAAQKKEIMDIVNEETAEETAEPAFEYPADTESVSVTPKREGRRKLSFDIVTAQVAVVIVLLLTVLLTNIFWKDSGINTLLRSVFAGSGAEKVEDKAYTEFSPYLPSRSREVTLEEGVMTFSGEGSVYSVCDGTVAKIAKNGDKLDITLSFSPSFSAVISGADYAYYNEGDEVYRSIPVCYSEGGEVKVYLYSDGKLLTDYMLDNGRIVWQS